MTIWFTVFSDSNLSLYDNLSLTIRASMASTTLPWLCINRGVQARRSKKKFCLSAVILSTIAVSESGCLLGTTVKTFSVIRPRT